MSIFLIFGVTIVIAIALVIYLKRKKESSPSSSGDSGASGSSCGLVGEICVGGKCCDTLSTCKNNICVGETSPTITTFLLGKDGKQISNDGEGLLQETDSLIGWPSIAPKEYWYWNGAGKMIYRTLTLNTSGDVVGIINGYLNGNSTGYASIDSNFSVGVALVKVQNNYAIYSPDFTLCLSSDLSGHLIWVPCLGLPSLFTIFLPSGCSPDNLCNCCYPGSECLDNKCSNCLGNTETFQSNNCPTNDFLVSCDQNSGNLSCVSKCASETLACPSGQHNICQENSSGSYNLICVSNCTGAQTPCEDGTFNSICTFNGSSWEWICPIDPCSLEEKAKHLPSDAPLIEGMIWNIDHYQPMTGSAPYLYPIWDCVNQIYTYQTGCNQNYKQVCSSDKIAVCGNSSNFQWQCLAPGTTDLCGLSEDKGVCGSDSTCMDISVCDGKDGVVSSNSPNDWRWICPSNASRCEAMEIQSWFVDNNVPVFNSSSVVTPVQKDVNTPIYPTINNNYCRSNAGTDNSHPDYSSLMGNPTGNILYNNGYPSLFVPKPSITDGNGPYLYTNYQGWNCVSENPCHPNGEFVNPDGSSFSELISINPPQGYEGAPTKGELFSVGKCVCNPGYAGNACQFTDSICSNQGTPISCNTIGGRCTSDQYQCACNPGFYGFHCQFTQSNCSNFGIPQNETDSLSCVCTGGMQGAICDKCIFQVSYPSLKDGTEYYILGYGMSGAYYFSADFDDIFMDCNYKVTNPVNGITSIFTLSKRADGFVLFLNITTHGITASYNIQWDGRKLGAYYQGQPTILYISPCGFLTDGNNNYFRYNQGEGSVDNHKVELIPISSVQSLNDLQGVLYFSSTGSGC
jgi:hypothetical protein